MNATRSTAELTIAVLPVTAVEVLVFAGRKILLVGNGSILRVVGAESQSVLCNFQVLQRQAIHGIVLVSCSEADEAAKLDFIVYGGRQVAWTVLDIAFHDEIVICTSLDIIDRITVKDWILSCTKSENSELIASFVTSYNALYHVEARRLTKQLHCWLLTDAVGVFLYSANLSQRHGNSYLIASGTVFGQVLVWSCTFDDHSQKWTVSRCVQFNGHHGSIFGVNVSKPRVVDGREYSRVVSCSDDRMIQVWDLPETESGTAKVDIVVSDDFKQCDQAIAKTYGHISRIWNVDFITNLHEDSLMVSTGEDGQAQSWFLDMQRERKDKSPYLRNAYVDRHHAGKHIWSRCHLEHENKITFYTGGADGQIISRRYDHTGRADIGSKYGSQTFKVIQSMVNEQTAARKRPLALKEYVVLDHGYTLATTDDGQLLRGNMDTDPIVWESITHDTKSTPLPVSTTTVSGHAFFIRTSDSTLCAVEYRHLQLTEICSVRQAKVANIWALDSNRNVDGHLEACIAISYHGHEVLELYWIEMIKGKPRLTDKSSVSLPNTFEITSVLYDKDLQILVYGSRAGAVALSINIVSATADETTTVCNRRVHSQDTVTSICKLAGNSQTQQPSFYLTTGRDGTYCIHKLDLDDSQTPYLQIVHQVSPLIGPSIEGANIVSQPDGSQVILLHGFHSKNFMVWNETSQTQVMSVDCGGAHRSWMFKPDETTGEGGVFVWTKAGNFVFCDQKTSDHEIIQTGGHGREIKALATHRQGRHRWLLATGSEDTDIRLFEYDNRLSDKPRFKNIAVIRKHTTGLQDLQFSSDGKILISAAGMEELYSWSLTPVPVIGQGVVFACALASTDAQSDARIMSFDMCVQHSQTKDQRPSYLMVTAYSNGRFKTMQLNPATESTKADFTLLHQLDFGTICLTQAHLSPTPTQEPDLQPSAAIIAATNGYIGISRISSSNDISNNTILPSSQHNPPTAPFHHKLHQNSITALQLHRLTAAHQLLVTGGDDNALAITIISTVPQPSTLHSSDTAQEYTFKSLLIPDAHAAALTALRVIPHPHPHPQFSQSTTPTVTQSINASNQPHHRRLTILTAGNDQRIQLWTVSIDISRLQSDTLLSDSLDEVQVEWVGEHHTDVADISGIDVLEGFESEEEEGGSGWTGSVEVVVVGVGMEVIRLSLDGNGDTDR